MGASCMVKSRSGIDWNSSTMRCSNVSIVYSPFVANARDRLDMLKGGHIASIEQCVCTYGMRASSGCRNATYVAIMAPTEHP